VARASGGRALTGIEFVSAACLALGAAASCGSRTELLAGEPIADAAPALQQDAPADTPADVPASGPCSDPGAANIYAIGSGDDTNNYRKTLYRFEPTSRSFETVGHIHCPGPASAPYSMAIDRQGTAYVDFSGGTFYRVDTRTAECMPTAFDSSVNGFVTFEVAFVANPSGGGETLFASGDTQMPPHWRSTLGAIATGTMAWEVIGDYSAGSGGTDSVIALAGTSDGRLFGLTRSEIVQIDPATAGVLTRETLHFMPNDYVSAGLAYWRGDLYLFASAWLHDSTRQTVPVRYDPKSGSTAAMDDVQINDTIVAAASSTCAPR
jgi:hypothetical protein